MKSWKLEFRIEDRQNFEEIRSGSKEYETRAASEKYVLIEEGDTLVFVCGEDKIQKKVIRKFHWRGIDEMITEIPYHKIMPSISSVEDMKTAYASYPGYTEKIEKGGILGFHLE